MNTTVATPSIARWFNKTFYQGESQGADRRIRLSSFVNARYIGLMSTEKLRGLTPEVGLIGQRRRKLSNKLVA